VLAIGEQGADDRVGDRAERDGDTGQAGAGVRRRRDVDFLVQLSGPNSPDPSSREAVVPRDRGRKVVATNRKARHDYHILDTVEAGLVLVGTEVKSLRAGRASLVDGFASTVDGEAWLEGVHIPEYAQGTWTNHEPRRKRKLLLHRDEIHKLTNATRERGLTIVPLSLYFSDGRAKVELAVARGKRDYDKRQALKERQDAREAARAMARREL
jgi:SsrA-binding protein